MRKILFRFSAVKEPPLVDKPSASNKHNYMLFPVNFPIPPYSVYVMKVNKYLHEYVAKNGIKYIAAFCLKPGAARLGYQPKSIGDLTQFLNLNPTVEKKEETPDKMELNYNCMIYDGVFSGKDEVPAHYITSIDQVYPIGSICTVNPTTNNSLFFRSEIRLNLNPSDYDNHEGRPISYVLGGSTIKSEPIKQQTKPFKQLLEIYDRLKGFSLINLPDITASQRHIPSKVVELISGYLCNVPYFSKDQIYDLFTTRKINEKIDKALKMFKEYSIVFEENWKDHGIEGDMNSRHKEAVETIYNNMKGLVGNVGEQKFIDSIRKKMIQRQYPQEIVKILETELMNLESQGAQDSSRKKHYIQKIADYPFAIMAKEGYDIRKAKSILEEDHYGMKKLKERILEFIAVSKLKGQFKSKVLLLYGPPGVGKTSIVKSIARCLNRPYGRVSLGGEYDTSIIKGHRKTYVGAYPGKIFDTILKSKVQNPVILLDEIDKVITRGGGASLQDSVMEVLDPIQNYKFKDDFMEIEIDLSKVLFICTANSLDTIFPPLLDRLERIQVSGYTTHEKSQIFQRYILEESKKNNGLEQIGKEVQFSKESINKLIEGYCKEAGVRSLVRKTNTILQKIAYKTVKGIDFPKLITPPQIQQYLGLPTFKDSRLFPGIPPKGVMIGLAYNNYGGSILYIQSIVAGQSPALQTEKPKDEKQEVGSLIITGNLQNVMKQSCQLAFTYAKYICSVFFNNHFLEKNEIHLNFPQIQIGKDGPSAGAAITSTLVSLALDIPATTEIAMTGEITLAGNITPIGGVKQKTMGAKRQGIKKLIFPKENEKDVEELEDEIKEGMTFVFANHYFDVLDYVFGINIEHQRKWQNKQTSKIV